MPEVVFLPGFMQHADSWSRVAAAVAERYPSRVVDFTTWTYDERIAEIHAAAGPGDVVVGYSMGGRLALLAALGGGPEAVGRSGTHPGAGAAEWGGLVLLGASAGIDPGARERRALEDEALAAWIETASIEEVVERWERNPVFASQAAETVAAQREGRLAHSPADLARLLRSAGQGVLEPVWDRLGELRMPVLTLAGENDSAYWDAAQRIASLARRGEARSIPDAGHAAHLEQPGAVAAAVLSWIGTVVAQAGHSRSE